MKITAENTRYPWNHWYPILLSKSVRPPRRGKQKLKKVKRFERDLVLWRSTDGAIHALFDRCPHRGAPLSLGEFVGDELQCGYHGFRFSKTGDCSFIPADNKANPKIPGFCAQSFPVKEKCGLIWLWWGDQEKATEHIPFFDEDFPERFPNLFEFETEIPLAFGRWMESCLDVHHFPWVHKNVKLPDLGPHVDPYFADVEGPYILTTGKVQKPGAKTNMSFRNHIAFPGVMLSEIPALGFVSLGASAPIDQYRTWTMLRPYYKKKHYPVFTTVKHWLMVKVFARFVLKQDMRIQTQQTPRDNGIGSDLLIARADQGSAAYQKMWTENTRRNRAVQPRNVEVPSLSS